MTCTDDDLERLKERFYGPHGAEYIVDPDDIRALLARLEASEKVIRLIDVGGFQLGGALDQWRKAAGK